MVSTDTAAGCTLRLVKSVRCVHMQLVVADVTQPVPTNACVTTSQLHAALLLALRSWQAAPV